MQASSLSKSDLFSWMCRPAVADYQFIDHPGLSTLIHCLKSTPSLAMADNADFLSLQMAATLGLCTPSSTEFGTVTHDLGVLLGYIRKRCECFRIENTSLQMHSPLAFEVRFATSRSVSDRSLYVTRVNSLVGLIGGEAKGEADAPNTAMSQAIQVSCDFLFHAVHVLGIPVTEAVIPFLVVCGGLVQFGAVYSLASEFYPVPVLLTEPMPVCPKTELYLVLEGLATYVRTHMLTWSSYPRVCLPKNLLRLRTAGYFFKPLQLFGQNRLFAGHQLRQLLGVFDALYKCEALRTSVVFPVGFIGFPGPDPATTTFPGEQFRSGLESAIGSQLLGRAVFMSAVSQTCKMSSKRKATSISSSERSPKKRNRRRISSRPSPVMTPTLIVSLTMHLTTLKKPSLRPTCHGRRGIPSLCIHDWRSLVGVSRERPTSSRVCHYIRR